MSSLIRRSSYHASTVVYVDSGTYYAIRRSDGTLTSSTDAATVIQTALNSGGRVFITAGTYPIAAGLTFSVNGTVLEGEGLSTILSFNGSSVPTCLKMADTTQRTIHIRNIKVISSPSTAGTCIDASYFIFSNFQNLDLTANIGLDFNVIGSYYNYIENSHIITAGIGGYGIRFQNTANENTVVRTRIGAGDNNPTGIYIDAHANALYDVDVEGGTFKCLYGLDFGANGHDTLVSGVYLEGNQTNIQFANGTRNPTFIGGFIVDATNANITDNGAIDPVFRNSRVGTGAYSTYSVENIHWSAGLTIPASTEFYIARNSAFSPTNRLTFNVPSSSQYDFLVSGSAKLQLSGSVANFNQNRITNPLSIMAKSSASDPTTSDITSGDYQVYKNTTSGAVKLWYNDGGVMKSVALT